MYESRRRPCRCSGDYHRVLCAPVKRKVAIVVMAEALPWSMADGRNIDSGLREHAIQFWALPSPPPRLPDVGQRVVLRKRTLAVSPFSILLLLLLLLPSSLSPDRYSLPPTSAYNGPFLIFAHPPRSPPRFTSRTDKYPGIHSHRSPLSPSTHPRPPSHTVQHNAHTKFSKGGQNHPGRRARCWQGHSDGALDDQILSTVGNQFWRPAEEECEGADSSRYARSFPALGKNKINQC